MANRGNVKLLWSKIGNFLLQPFDITENRQTVANRGNTVTVAGNFAIDATP